MSLMQTSFSSSRGAKAYAVEVLVNYSDGPDGLAGESFLDAYADKLFEQYQGDLSLSILSGRPYVGGYVEAGSYDEAVSLAVSAVQRLGLEPLQVAFDLDETALAA